MKKSAVFFAGILIIALLLAGCKSGLPGSGPQAVLDKYFSSAVKRDYSAAYDCYYAAYRARITRQQYIEHRSEDPSVLRAFKILSLRQAGDTAHAEVALTFASARDVSGLKPVSINVKEDMIKEGGEWRIKVW